MTNENRKFAIARLDEIARELNDFSWTYCIEALSTYSDEMKTLLSTLKAPSREEVARLLENAIPFNSFTRLTLADKIIEAFQMPKKTEVE